MMVNSARLLVSNLAPQKRLLSRRQWRLRHRLFGESSVLGGFLSRDTGPAILGTFALQAGSFACWLGHQQWAAALSAGGIACWTWAAIARGADQGRKRKNPIQRSLNGATAVVLAITLSVVALGGGAGPGTGGGASGGNTPPTGWLEATSRALEEAVNPPKEPPAPPKAPPVRVFIPRVETATMGQGSIPGLILLPNQKKPQSVTIPATYRLRLRYSHPNP